MEVAQLEVMKFGGTSVKDGVQFRKVAQIVSDKRNAGTKVAVVLSAMAGVTNDLEDLANRLRSDSVVHGPQDSEDSLECTGQDMTKYVEEVMASLREKHFTAITDAGLSDTETQVVQERLDKVLNRLNGILMGTIQVEDFSKKTQDLVLSFGERLSTLILAGVLRDMDIPSRAFESETAGIHVTGDAVVDPDYQATTQGLLTSVQPLIEDGGVPVITGYYGINGNNAPKIIGRGGSDLSGAVVARCLHATMLEIWTDVDGFMTADPSMVEEASIIERMSYREAAELAYFGAGVLHPRTIEAVHPVNIPILIKNTFSPQTGGTLITSSRARRGEFPTNGDLRMEAVALKEHLSIIKLGGSGLAYQPDFGSNVLKVLGGLGVNTYAISTSLASFSIIIDREMSQPVLDAIGSLEGMAIDEVIHYDDVALVCVVGDEIEERVGIAAKIFSAIADDGINIRMISEGASDVAINFVVDGKDKHAAARTIHDRFIK